MRNVTKLSVLYIILLTSCATLATPKQVTIIPSATATLSPTHVIPTLTELPSKPVLQLTYLSPSADTFGEIYALDVTCMTDESLCFAPPHLLLKTPGRTPDTSDPNIPGSIANYAWSPDGKRIALCAGGVDGSDDIFFANMTSPPLTWINLTHNPIEECNPRWDKNGENVFYAGCSFDLYGGCQTFKSNIPRGEKQAWVKDTETGFYDLSLDGKKVVFTKTIAGHEHIYISDLSGSNLQQVTIGDGDDKSPLFSPDGQSIVFVRWYKKQTKNDIERSDIVIKNLRTDVEKNITEEIDKFAVYPSFSPDGNWIAFNVYKFGEKGNHIFVYSIVKSITIQVTSGDSNYMEALWRLSNQP